MNNSLGSSQPIANTPDYYASAVLSQTTGRDPSRERAQRLYAMGELAAAARLLTDLATGKARRRATDRSEAPRD
jgi:hypothetical protein